MKFEALLKTWKDTYPDADPDVVRLLLRADDDGSCAAGFTIIRWAPMREVGGEADFTPV